MNSYRVATGVAKFGQGQVFTLSPKQIKDRRHNLELPKTYDGKADCVVTALAPLEFKAGEVIGLPELQRVHVDVLVPIEPPKTGPEKVAVQKDAARVADAAKAKSSKRAA